MGFPRATLDLLFLPVDKFLQHRVELFGVTAMMGPTMAVSTYCYDEVGVIGAAVRQSPNMVRLEVRLTRGRDKGARSPQPSHIPPARLNTYSLTIALRFRQILRRSTDSADSLDAISARLSIRKDINDRMPGAA